MNATWTGRVPLGPIAAAVLLFVLVGVTALSPTNLFYGLLLLLVATGILVAYSFENLLVLYIWLHSVIHLLKRAIFLLGPQSQMTYYSVLFLPTLVFIPMILTALPRVKEGWRLWPTRLLVGYILLNVLTTVAFPAMSASWLARFAALHERLMGVTAFLAGLVIPLATEGFRRSTRSILYATGLSVAYGVILYTGGPTVLEREWAHGTAAYSIQGQKVLDYLLAGQGLSEWRGFSYFADPATWGLFLLAGAGALVVLRSQQPASVGAMAFPLWGAVLLIGLFICLTRTPWVGLFGMLGTYLLLRWRPAQRPPVMMALVAGCFAFVVLFGTFLFEHVMPRSTVSGDPILSRYATIGTIRARTGAWEGLQAAAATFPVRGGGLAYSGYLAGRLGGQTVVGDVGGHNFLMEITVASGVPGLLLFLAFLYSVFASGLRTLRTARSPEAVRWLLAFIMGYIVTGFLTGSLFMNVHFFLLAGVLVGTELEQPRPTVRHPEEAAWPAPEPASSSSATRTWSA